MQNVSDEKNMEKAIKNTHDNPYLSFATTHKQLLSHKCYIIFFITSKNLFLKSF